MSKDKKEKKPDKKAAKAKAMLRDFLERERTHLETMTINLHSPELLITSAPDTYSVIRAYFDRRLAEL